MPVQGAEEQKDKENVVVTPVKGHKALTVKPRSVLADRTNARYKRSARKSSLSHKGWSRVKVRARYAQKKAVQASLASSSSSSSEGVAGTYLSDIVERFELQAAKDKLTIKTLSDEIHNLTTENLLLHGDIITLRERCVLQDVIIDGQPIESGQEAREVIYLGGCHLQQELRIKSRAALDRLHGEVKAYASHQIDEAAAFCASLDTLVDTFVAGLVTRPEAAGSPPPKK